MKGIHEKIIHSTPRQNLDHYFPFTPGRLITNKTPIIQNTLNLLAQADQPDIEIEEMK